MGTPVSQNSFAAGELSPQLAGRTDFAKYYTGLHTCLNFIVRQYGGLDNRPGTHLVCEVADSTKFTRLIPFQYNNQQTYVIEAGNQALRLIANGGLVVSATPYNVTGESKEYFSHPNGWRAVLTIASHPFSDGDIVIITGVDPNINGTRAIKYVDANNIAVLGVNISAVNWSGGGTLQSTTSFVPVVVSSPWTSDETHLLKYTQSADIMTICHPNHPPQQLSRTSSVAFNLAAFVNTNGPFQEINVDITKTMKADGVIGTVHLTSVFDIFTAGNIGQLLRLEAMPDSDTPAWEVQKAIAINQIVRAGAQWYQAITAGTTGTVKPSGVTPGDIDADGIPGVKWLYAHSGYGIVKITAVTDSKHATATVIRRLPDLIASSSGPRIITNVISGTSPSAPDPGTYAQVVCAGHGFITGQTVTIASVVGAVEVNGVHQVQVIDVNNFYVVGVYETTPYTSGGTATWTNASVADTYKWAFEAWKNDQGYPMSVGYFQQRQIFGATAAKPQTSWMSQVAGYDNFEQNIPLLDDDAITLPIFSRRVNEIRHILDLDALVLFTSDGPFIVNGGQSANNAVITPATISTKRQGANGISHVPPLLVNEQALFVQEKGSQVRSLGYSFQNDKYIGQDLTVLSNHLFQGMSIVDWAYQEIPYSCVWAVRDDGVMLGLTYFPEQQVAGWHRHTTDGLFESVCCITENNVDALYVVVNRTINGQTKRYIERFDDRQFTDIRDAFFVDCGLTYDGRNAGATINWTLTGGTDWLYTESLTFTTDADWFVGASDIGDAIIITSADGTIVRLTIIAYTSARIVTVQASRTVPADLRNVSHLGFDMARNTFAGLDHLEGKLVAILADGNADAQQVVTGGMVTLEYPGVVVHAGLPFTSDMQTLDINDTGRDIRANQKRINRVSLVVENSLGFSVGKDADNLMEYKQRNLENYDETTTSLTGITDPISIPADWSKPGRIFVRQDKPLPLSVLSSIPEVDLGGI